MVSTKWVELNGWFNDCSPECNFICFMNRMIIISLQVRHFLVESFINRYLSVLSAYLTWVSESFLHVTTFILLCQRSKVITSLLDNRLNGIVSETKQTQKKIKMLQCMDSSKLQDYDVNTIEHLMLWTIVFYAAFRLSHRPMYMWFMIFLFCSRGCCCCHRHRRGSITHINN